MGYGTCHGLAAWLQPRLLEGDALRRPFLSSLYSIVPENEVWISTGQHESTPRLARLLLLYTCSGEQFLKPSYLSEAVAGSCSNLAQISRQESPFPSGSIESNTASTCALATSNPVGIVIPIERTGFGNHTESRALPCPSAGLEARDRASVHVQ